MVVFSFRDLLHTKYKSSTKAKMRKRKNTQRSSTNEPDEKGKLQKRKKSQKRGAPFPQNSQPTTISHLLEGYVESGNGPMSLPTASLSSHQHPLLAPLTSLQSQRRTSLGAFVEPIGSLSQQQSWFSTAAKPPPLDERISASIFDLPMPQEVSSSHQSLVSSTNLKSEESPERKLDAPRLESVETFGSLGEGTSEASGTIAAESNANEQSGNDDEQPVGPEIFEL